ncbi:hypothetical protein FQA39_LY17763 [Lamprigera yunnana]|nr:hypothetical protein FQA39_LY17763 [Lamprigera yunnana]
MSWSREEVICLIEEYRKWPNLYTVKSVNCKNRNLRKTALESIENSLKKSKPNITSTEIQNKFQSLKQNALKEYKKWKNSYKSGAGEDKVYEPSLWYFQIISFVIADNVPRESQDTLDGTENTKTQIQEFDSVMDPSINEHESEYEEVYSGIVSPDGSVSLEGVPFVSNNEKRPHSAMSVPVDSVTTICAQLPKERMIKNSNTKYNINDFKKEDFKTMLQRIYYLNKSKSKWISVGLYHPFEFASVVKIFGRSQQYVIFEEEEWMEFCEQRENINKYFQTCDMMWKPRQIGSKILTFEMIEEKKILRIEDLCGNEVYLEIQFIKKMWMLCAEHHWTKAIDLKSAVERLYEKLGALEFDADYEAIYGMQKHYTTIPKRKDVFSMSCETHSDIGLQHFLDTISKHIKDCSDSDTSSYSSDEEECNEAVKQNGEDSKTTEEEESKKSESGRNTKPFP